MIRYLLAIVALLVASPALADCTSPAATETTMIYSSTYHTYQFCNGTAWVPMNGGTTIYSAGGSTNPTFTAANGYFVLTAGTYTGNLGGLSGANATCLTELTNNNWNGKSAAQGFGILNATHVFAYLCDGSTCNTPTAGKKYYFANAADASAGGSYFTPDGNGSFGYDTASYCGTSDNVSYSALSTFNTLATYWTNRAVGCGMTSSNTPNSTTSSSNCSGFSSTTGTAYAGISNSSIASRYANSQVSCASSLKLVCMVNP